MTRTIAALMTFVLLAGCAFVPFRHNDRHREAREDRQRPAVAEGAPAGEAVPAPAPDPTACRLGLLKVLEGRPGSAVLAAEALDLSGARSIRWMHPGEAVTMDFRPDRLNIKLTHANIVKSFVCG